MTTHSTYTNRFYLSTIGRVLKWARSRSLWYLSTGGNGCCADEVLNMMGCTYDVERLGCLLQTDPRQSDLLIVSGVVTHAMAPYLKNLYAEMPSPKYVLSVGACANCGGLFASEVNYSVLLGVHTILPVDVYIPGCPPRPEAIMNGIIALQDKITQRNPP